ncbi:MAG: endonuclease mitochondrial [Chthoniobacter sp.]|nr:endonuclease mitochondrial [Chthoniobacter sp.]
MLPSALPLPRHRVVSFISVVFILLLAGLSARAAIGTALQMQLGNPSNASADPNNHAHYLIQRTVEAIDYNDSLGEPNWASWDLTASDVGSSGRSATFYTDTTLPASFYWVTTGDYTGSGYDRGHMAPSADRTDNVTDNDLVFYMSNIIPQAADNNQGPWEVFEAYCRTLASSGNEILITSGGSGYSGAFIASGKAAIPGYTWKIAVVVPTGGGSALTRIDNSTRVICIKIPNVAGIRSNPWSQYVTSASQIQADTGYAFFTALPTKMATVLRAKVDGAPAPVLSSFSPTAAGANTMVVITGNGFTSASSVLFNGGSASFIVNSDTKITAAVPAGASSGPISVIAPGGLAESTQSFTVPISPTITNFQPTSGAVNASVVITGSGLSSATSVTFNGTSAAFAINSDTQITTSVPTGATSGAIGVVTVSGSATAPASFSVLTSGPGDLLYISQVYGGGGNTGALYKSDFIELYNAGTTTIDLSTYAVQYASASGSTWQETLLSGLLLPGHYYLIQEAQGSSGTASLPTPQLSGTMSLAASSGKVALTKTQALLSGTNPLSNGAVIDFLGYGTANAYEGGSAGIALSATTSAQRLHAGASDSNNNSTDFIAGAPIPRNTTAMEAWRNRTFSAAELALVKVSGSLANPSGDGMTNLGKYSFNLDPHHTDAALAVSYGMQSSGKSHTLTLTHRKNHFAADITFSYEWSSDTMTWSPLNGVTSSVVPVDAETDAVSISTSSTNAALFLRVKVAR